MPGEPLLIFSVSRWSQRQEESGFGLFPAAARLRFRLPDIPMISRRRNFQKPAARSEDYDFNSQGSGTLLPGLAICVTQIAFDTEVRAELLNAQLLQRGARNRRHVREGNARLAREFWRIE